MAYHGPTQRPRTYTQEQWSEAQAAWAAGEYRADFWREWRHLAATAAGIIAAPRGTRWDSWGDDDPSERALIARAIDESPSLLRSILRGGRVHSWAQVVRLLVQERDDMAESATRREEAWLARKVEPMTPLRSIAQTIMDSIERQEAPR